MNQTNQTNQVRATAGRPYSLRMRNRAIQIPTSHRWGGRDLNDCDHGVAAAAGLYTKDRVKTSLDEA
jgi:hypothetical protein